MEIIDLFYKEDLTKNTTNIELQQKMDSIDFTSEVLVV